MCSAKSTEVANKPLQEISQVPVKNEVIKITNVKVNSTVKGLEVVLETSQGQKLQVVPKSDGNKFKNTFLDRNVSQFSQYAARARD